MSDDKRYRIVHPREYESRGETKTHWLREDGSMSGELHSVPVGTGTQPGGVRIMLFRADEEGKKRERRQETPREPEQTDLDDDIPF